MVLNHKYGGGALCFFHASLFLFMFLERCALSEMGALSRRWVFGGNASWIQEVRGHSAVWVVPYSYVDAGAHGWAPCLQAFMKYLTGRCSGILSAADYASLGQCDSVEDVKVCSLMTSS